ncbi:hypothetical protein BCV72DRAFT_301684 [Rhizopus microsporus var. microsporus]|uniref:Uncharacterized protein n=1 Tax=Rhizopus microsporus var. microsporus TaxID=86635 RepID=A0A1X0RF73_RHIZD|nr:hypothetical protein BCV72DRAFT_301684 [Rhizopus microsporus var. microsporus]
MEHKTTSKHAAVTGHCFNFFTSTMGVLDTRVSYIVMDNTPLMIQPSSIYIKLPSSNSTRTKLSNLLWTSFTQPTNAFFKV